MASHVVLFFIGFGCAVLTTSNVSTEAFLDANLIAIPIKPSQFIGKTDDISSATTLVLSEVIKNNGKNCFKVLSRVFLVSNYDIPVIGVKKSDRQSLQLLIKNNYIKDIFVLPKNELNKKNICKKKFNISYGK